MKFSLGVLLLPIALIAQVPPTPETIFGDAGLACQGAGNSSYPGFLAYTFNFSSTNKANAGGGGGGRVVFPDVSVTKGLDDCTPLLLQAVATGKRIPTVTLTLVKGTATILILKLEEVVVTGQQFAEDGADAANVRDVDETVTLAFQKITITHVPSGKSFGWNVATNKPA
jgi:type VI secretion system secreted protein Hcp